MRRSSSAFVVVLRWRSQRSLPASPAWGGSALIYVTNSAGDSIHVIDPATNKVVQEIKGIEAAHGIALGARRLAHLCQQRGRQPRSTCSIAKAAP